MKKKIEKELYNLAEEILNNKGRNNIAELKAQALKLYDKLTLLGFTEKFVEEAEEAQPQSEIQKERPKKELEKEQREKERERASYFAPDGTEYRDSDAITEPATEKIKNIVSQMPPEAEQFNNLFRSINVEEQQENPPQPQEPRQHQVPSPARETPQRQTPPEQKSPSQPHTSQPQARREPPYSKPQEASRPEVKKEEPREQKNDIHDFGVDYDSLPTFEPVNQNGKMQRPRSLNDRLKKGINIGLNERLSFIKHLFEGNTADYNRVLSQLNTFDSLEEAHKFIQLVVKPDYNNWEGKEEQEQRFWEKIENKFN
ncbi:hypothetical protein RM553_12175 [Zunongwangia sp. F363]|uniref:Uncharacterized protein n=1 Tax=Autumnicola tepida TaxID=3075595 RepID=A0ABU3CB83_9FLAO|nr:hypothetical protein [Zunongwangia sp. F363]MDT0643591.1 hypothetical protein [Zunongwangia sp. F363]